MRNGGWMSKGMIFDIQRFCLHDGPGIRTVVFLKGCPLSCQWCSNPESQSFDPELLVYAEKCIGCGACRDVCARFAITLTDNGPEVDRNKCAACGECAAHCPSSALRLSGEEYSVTDAVEELLKDKLYFEVSGGGVTLSGGEPLAQPGFVTELLMALKQHGIHTAIETCGDAEWSVFEQIMDYTDLFLFDIKNMNSHDHETATGGDNKLILNNFESLARRGKELTVRVPVIPGWNSDAEHLQRLAGYAGKHGVSSIELLPYHSLGRSKYSALGRTCSVVGLKAPDRDLLSDIAEKLQKFQ